MNKRYPRRRFLADTQTVVLSLLFAATFLQPLPSLAQGNKAWRIGFLEITSATLNTENMTAFRLGMAEHGYVEGRNYAIVYRSGDGNDSRYPALAADLVRAKVDLIVTRGTPATLAAKAATKTVPVVTTAIAEPLIVVESLSRPGGNVTGLTSLSPALLGKRLQMLREIVPGVARIATVQNMGSIAVPPFWTEIQKAAKVLGVQTALFDVRRPEDFAPAFERAAAEHWGAVVMGGDGLVNAERHRIVALAAKHRLPAIYESRQFVEAGGLISYGVSYPALYRRAASYVDRIFKGARPGDLPIEQPTEFDLVINMRAAEAFGVRIPPELVVRASKIIE